MSYESHEEIEKLSKKRDRFLAISKALLQALLAIDPEAMTASEEKSMEDYAQLQRRVLLATLVLTLVVATVTFFVFDIFVARSLVVGALAGILYLRLLARSVGQLNGYSRQVNRFQLLVPILLVITASRLPELEFLPAFLGFLLYKPALLIQAIFDV
uniref:Possible H+-transporting ATP synthase n=1 Tax=Paulinella chromatophora TaxID=39717 RepID=B1X3Y0_PAUCH|nr:possible H+-transporting ATP synthase [Paulinella chromatophora]ACB42649.1 possible H+-transporting ATP synthase [Paulinella chromatophora]